MGGHFEKNESPEENACLGKHEETGPTLLDSGSPGILTLLPRDGRWSISAFSPLNDLFLGELKSVNEGTLEWVKRRCSS